MKNILLWGLLIIGGLVLAASGVYLGVVRLDEADKWGSVAGAVVALLGLPMTVYGIVLARRGRSAARVTLREFSTSPLLRRSGCT